MNNINFLEIAEYISLAVFVFGSVIAAYFGQIIWAAAPLCVLISLNIINRYQVEQLSRKSLTSISGVRDVVEQQVEELKTAMPKLDRDAQNPLPTQDLERLFLTMEKLQEQLYYQGQSVEAVRNQMDALAQQFKEQSDLQQPDSLREALSKLSQGIANLQQQLHQPPASPRVPLASAENLNYAQPNQYQKTANSAPRNSQRAAIDAELQQRLNQLSPSEEAPSASPGNFHDSEPKQYHKPANSAIENSQKATIDAEEILRRYEAGERDFTGVNLVGANLSGVCLDGVNLKYANMSKVKLREASLQSAHLEAADLIAADLRGANLYQASLTGAKLTEADLRATNLANASLCGANLAEADLCGSNLSDASLRGANLKGAKLHPADMLRAELGGAIMPDGTTHE